MHTYNLMDGFVSMRNEIFSREKQKDERRKRLYSIPGLVFFKLCPSVDYLSKSHFLFLFIFVCVCVLVKCKLRKVIRMSAREGKNC